MLRTLICFSFLAIIAFTSCTKKTGSKKACFNISKASPKVGDTLYFLNCSENYKSNLWTMPDGTIQTSRHASFVAPAAGTYTVRLTISSDYVLFVDTTNVIKTFTSVIP
jgi:hypothetical protein